MKRTTRKPRSTKPPGRIVSLPAEFGATPRDYFKLLEADEREPPARADRFIISRVPVIVAQQAEYAGNEAKTKFGNVIRFLIQEGTPLVEDLPGVQALCLARSDMMAAGSIDDAGWLDRSWLAINDLHGEYKTIWTRTEPGETTECGVLAQQLGLRTSPIAILAMIAVLAQMSVVAPPAKRYLGELFIDAARRIKARARRAVALSRLEPETAEGACDWAAVMARINKGD